MSCLSSLCNRLFRKFKPNQATQAETYDYQSPTPVSKILQSQKCKDFHLNRLFHVQMHLDGANPAAIISEATRLLVTGAQWDESQILFHIGGGSINASCAPTVMDEAMLQFVRDRGVSLEPLREHAKACWNCEWLDMINRVSRAGDLTAEQHSWEFLTRALLSSGCTDPMEFLKTVKRPTIQGLHEAMALNLAACELMAERGRERSQKWQLMSPQDNPILEAAVNALAHHDEEALLPNIYNDCNSFWTQEAMPIWTGRMAEEVIREVMRKRLDEATSHSAATSRAVRL